MLILTRRAGENLVVGDDIVVSVIEVRGDTVRIGIEAPRSREIYREEVWLALKSANAEAASASDAAVSATLEQLRARRNNQSAGRQSRSDSTPVSAPSNSEDKTPSTAEK